MYGVRSTVKLYTATSVKGIDFKVQRGSDDDHQDDHGVVADKRGEYVRTRVGVVPQADSLDADVTVLENILDVPLRY